MIAPVKPGSRGEGGRGDGDIGRQGQRASVDGVADGDIHGDRSRDVSFLARRQCMAAGTDAVDCEGAGTVSDADIRSPRNVGDDSRVPACLAIESNGAAHGAGRDRVRVHGQVHGRNSGRFSCGDGHRGEGGVVAVHACNQHVTAGCRNVGDHVGADVIGHCRERRAGNIDHDAEIARHGTVQRRAARDLTRGSEVQIRCGHIFPRHDGDGCGDCLFQGVLAAREDRVRPHGQVREGIHAVCIRGCLRGNRPGAGCTEHSGSNALSNQPACFLSGYENALVARGIDEFRPSRDPARGCRCRRQRTSADDGDERHKDP